MNIPQSRSEGQIKGLYTSYDDKETFFIIAVGAEYKLYVEPESRRNGTQAYDGYFPRFFSEVRFAKASLTKFLRKPDKWEEL